MAIFRAQVIIPADSAVPRDACVNTFGFQSAQDGADLATTIVPFLKGFYDGWANYRAGLMDWANTRVKVYDMGDPKPRVPHADLSLGLSATAAATNMPSEVAVCLTIQAARVSGENQRRRRGRLYLGPLAVVANASSSGRPDTPFRTAIGVAAEGLRTAVDPSPCEWVVISQPTPASPVTASVVVGGWIDDAFDTQRRRGAAPTTRLVWGV